MDLQGRVAIVTGASRGIGKVIAVELAKHGAKVVVAARTVEPRRRVPGTIGETVEEIRRGGGEALAVPCDVLDSESVSALVHRTVEAFEQIDILVNNAGIGTYKSFLETGAEEWDQVLAVDLQGVVALTKEVLPHMVERRRGSIVNISSTAADHLFSGIVNKEDPSQASLMGLAYGTAKAALERFTWGLAAELGQHNIAVNALKPMRPVITEGLQVMRPGGDFSQWVGPEKMAKATVFLAGQDASGVTGQVVTDEEVLRTHGLA